MPWTRHGAGHTYQFDAHVAWLATKTSKTAARELMRTAWRTVGKRYPADWGCQLAPRGCFRLAARRGQRLSLRSLRG
ncbi:transposase family protein [Arthrobacter sp. A5]|uniref:transposase family protein n=1 Tax=Arthrobacter sp. A5 TaxID=576926 RepID=UPI003DA96A41